MEKPSSVIKEFAKSIFGSILFVMVLTQFILKPIQVNQSSMYPTLKDQQLGFSNILSFKLFGVERFDVVIFYAEQMDDYLVKRVIGLPGETLEYKEGILFVDGLEVKESFLNESYKASIIAQYGYFTQDFGPITLAEDEVFLMGDNRPYSTDSRDFGAFNLKDIVCKDVVVFYPLDQISFVHGVKP